MLSEAKLTVSPFSSIIDGEGWLGGALDVPLVHLCVPSNSLIEMLIQRERGVWDGF